ncbi:MAG: peroxide stress protein YaaA [Eubacterium sp.]|nr:peroxide stress protein YaaA [Eubacterium sp.]
MRIILSPAKKMRLDLDCPAARSTPVFLSRTTEIMRWLQGLSYSEAKKLWACNDKIAEENYSRLQEMDLQDAAHLTPAILSYDGIAFQYMAPAVFEEGYFDYVQEHLRILSGFYGVLKPMDGVTPYRLEMQAKTEVAGKKNLYDYWGDALYREARDDSGLIINLASREYSCCIEKYLQPEDRYITCIFGEAEGGRIVQKGVYAKMARGDMVRFMAENQVEEPEQLKNYNRMHYRFSEEQSSDTEYVFIREV